jgi:hypothetical protein
MDGSIQVATDFWFPSEWTLRTAHRLADRLSPKQARVAVAQLFERECSAILGAGDRREMLEDFFDQRAARQHRLLEGLGLSRTSTTPCLYGPGTWRLSADGQDPKRPFVISGIRTASEGEVVAFLSANDFTTASLAWRAVTAAAGVDANEKLRASEWYRIWWGFDRRTVRRPWHSTRGVRGALWQDFMSREQGGRS